MNRPITKVILGIVAIFVVILIIKNCGDGSKSSGLEYVPHNDKLGSLEQPSAIDLYLDASGSMAGYVKGVQGSFKKNIPLLTTNAINRNTINMPADSISCFTIKNSKVASFATDAFCSGITKASIFSGPATEIHVMFNTVVSKILANRNHVGVIASDCILSFPEKELKSNPNKNIDDIAILESNVTRSVTQLTNAGLSVAVVQYLSDFNGDYYYNYRNKVQKSTQKVIMQNRPYYLILIGSKGKIESLFSKNVIPSDYEGIYMFNPEPEKPISHIIRAQRSGVVSEVTNNIPEIRVAAQGDPAYFYLGIEDFAIAPYVDVKTMMSHPLFTGDLIASVEPVEYNVVRDDHILKGNEATSCSFFYRVTLKDNSSLRNVSNVTDQVFFVGQSLDASNSSIENDLTDSVATLEGRTFMFSHFIDAINQAYVGLESKIAVVDITIKKLDNN